MAATVVVLDPVLEAAAADEMLRLAERFGDYGLYSQETSSAQVWTEVPERFDSIRNYLGNGGIRRDQAVETPGTLAARTNYFRENFAYGNETVTDGIESFLTHPALIDAAHQVHGRPIIEPAIAFANVMVPGQELAIHTDVAEFRGANRRHFPQWLLVAMAHSGLFEEYRLHIATGVSWFGHAEGGDFLHWPDGSSGTVAPLAAKHNTAAVLDTDSVFHGVARVGAPESPVPPLRAGMQMAFDPATTRWVLTKGPTADADTVAEFRWDELRLSVSWKAYCFADDAARNAWRSESEPCTLTHVLETLANDMSERQPDSPCGPGSLDAASLPQDQALAEAIIDCYVRFPQPV